MEYNGARYDYVISVTVYKASFLIIPRVHMRSEVYGRVFVCVSLSRLLQLLNDQWSAFYMDFELLVSF